MKNEFLLREEFINWLINYASLTEESAKSYCSYVAGADKTFSLSRDGFEEDTNLFSILKNEVYKGDSFAMDRTIISVIDELSKDGIDKVLNKPISTINKYRSALFQYIEFLFYFIETEIEVLENSMDDNFKSPETSESENGDFIITEMTDEDELLLNGFNSNHKEIDASLLLKYDESYSEQDISNYSYSKADLYKRFYLRLITQDRLYSHIFYPIRFIKRFLYLKGEKKYIDEWLTKLLDNTIIHLESEKIQLHEISSLDIIDKKVYVNYNGKSNLVLTKLSDNVTLIPFEVKELKKVALDHEVPLLSIMSDNMDKLKTLQEITSEIKKNIKGKLNAKNYKIANNEVLKSTYIETLDLENLKNELELISSKTNLQLMDSGFNSSKGIN